MSNFFPETLQFGGACCGARYLHTHIEGLQNPGVFLSFNEPFPPKEGYESVTVETEYGNIYFEFSHLSPEGTRIADYTYHESVNTTHENEWCHHFYVNSVISTEWTKDNTINVTSNKPKNSDQFHGVGIIIQTIPPASRNPVDMFEKGLGTSAIYLSDPFYNMIHQERKVPSLRLAVYKGH